MKFFGGSTFLEAVINPAGWLHSKQNEESRKQAEAATEAARAQAEAAKADLELQQQTQTLQAEQAALESSQGGTSGTTTVGSSVDAVSPLRTKRRRGADITVGL